MSLGGGTRPRGFSVEGGMTLQLRFPCNKKLHCFY